MNNRNNRHLFAVLFLALALLLLSACGSGNAGSAPAPQPTAAPSQKTPEASKTEAAAPEETGLLAEIRSRGYITIGTEGTWSPYTYHDENDQLVGYDVEVARYIADYLGVEARFSETVWSSMFASLDAGQIDIIVNGVSYTDERAEKYDFSIPYSYQQKAILVPADNTDINGLADLPGKIAANDSTSTIGQLALDSGAELDPVGEMAQSISEVLNGRADCTLNNLTAFEDYFKQHPEAREQVKIVTATEPEPSAYVPVLKGNESLVSEINAALTQGLSDGTFASLSDTYFGVNVTGA